MPLKRPQKSHGKPVPAPPVGAKTRRCGVAFDIGTTTIAAATVDLSTGAVMESLSLPNPQREWGADVLARIQAVAEDPAMLGRMRACAIDACNQIIHTLTKDPQDIIEITAAGNPVMEHIFLGISPEPIGRVPFKPAFREAKRIGAADAGLLSSPGTLLYAFPLVSGFVGGDAVAVVLATGMDEAGPAAALAVDIGTNSEIMLASKGVVYATSAAAGPAFEAGGLKHGMTAQHGAIQGARVTETGVTIDVIGNVTPRGICGSGLVEAVAGMLGAGVMDTTGRILGKEDVPATLCARIKEGPDGNSFVLYRGASGELTISQQDVRSLQSAKSAIKAGIAVLMDKSGLKPGDIGKVYLAGAFGSNLKPGSLAAIGLLDPVWTDKAASIGDAALLGAASVIGSDEGKTRTEALARAIKYVPLSGTPSFEREFIRNMDF